jgi:hypothetical protein
MSLLIHREVLRSPRIARIGGVTSRAIRAHARAWLYAARAFYGNPGRQTARWGRSPRYENAEPRTTKRLEKNIRLNVP